MLSMKGFISCAVSPLITDHIQTCTDPSIKESDQERQRHADEVEDLRKQLSKAAAEAMLALACTCNLSLCGKHHVHGLQIDIFAGIDMGGYAAWNERYACLVLNFMCGFPGDSRPYPNMHRPKHKGVRPGASEARRRSWRSSKTAVQGSCWSLLALACTCNLSLCGKHHVHGLQIDIFAGIDMGWYVQKRKVCLVFLILFFPWWFLTISKHAQTQALRSQTRSVSGTQKKLKIFENSCPRQLLPHGFSSLLNRNRDRTVSLSVSIPTFQRSAL